MKKLHVFNAGPCLLPQEALDRAAEAIRDFQGTGISVLSISHRTKEWEAVMDGCRALWKELLNIPDDYEVLFLGGGASLQFLYIAMNFLEEKGAYLETGVWAKKALKEAKGFAGTKGAEAVAVASSADRNFCYIPKGYEIPADADYFHITTNNTISGDDFWKTQPEKYPKKYYGFSTKVRTNIFLGQRFCYHIPKRNRLIHQSISAYYEISSCDLYIVSKATNKEYPWSQTLSLAFGLLFEL